MNLMNRKLVRTVQVILGLYLIFSGVVGLFELFALPEMNAAGTAFISALFATGYLFPLVGLIFLASGVMFLFNRWSAFGAIILVPVTLNILLFHIFLEFSGFWFAFIFTLLNLYLLKVHWKQYGKMFSRK